MCGHILQGANGGQTGTEQRRCATGAPDHSFSLWQGRRSLIARTAATSALRTMGSGGAEALTSNPTLIASAATMYTRKTSAYFFTACYLRASACLSGIAHLPRKDSDVRLAPLNQTRSNENERHCHDRAQPCLTHSATQFAADVHAGQRPDQQLQDQR